MSNKSLLICLFFGSFISAFFWNELNKNTLRKEGISLRQNATVITNDDYSYLHPFDNFQKSGSFYEDELGKYTTIIRSPGYGSFYFTFSVLFGKTNSLFFLYLFQLILFSLSAVYVYKIAWMMTLNLKTATFISMLYGFLPFSMGFLNYTLTEGITPALGIFGLFFFLRARQNFDQTYYSRNFFISAFIFALLILVRPVLSFLLIPLLLLILSENAQKLNFISKLKFAITFFIISISLIGLWGIRNRIVIGHWVSIHPIYQNEVPGVFRLPHHKAWEFFKGWESSGAHFHGTIVPFWEKTMNGDTSEATINQFINRIPIEVRNVVGELEIKQALKPYSKSILDQKPYFDQNQVMFKSPLISEKIAAEKFDQLTKAYKRNNPANYYFKTPVLVVKNLIFHSNLSMHCFQVSYRGVWFIEILRFICFVIHSTSFLLIPISIFLFRKNKFVIYLSISIFIYLFYLSFFQRGIEERYTLPVLPFVLIFFGMAINNLYLRLKSRLNF
jgi:hypothetical protein